MVKFDLHPQNPNKRDVKTIVDILKDGGIGVIPTDSVYALTCLKSNKDGIERIIKITGKAEKKAKLSLLCKDLKEVADHTLPYDNHIFKTMKRYLPGPYTFILNANSSVTKFFKNNKKEIGIRIPDNEVVQGILEILDEPLISTSLNLEDSDFDFLTGIEGIEAMYKGNIDFVVDSGPLELGETTILDCTSGEIILVREGKGVID
ncbi:MAG TPA: L-threonylcarbamoyladenylate synthase [Saprospiraceae bacterium]|nr:L-threonylcarbamoyladenylate synthase [Saprospiraceae bacterium]